MPNARSLERTQRSRLGEAHREIVPQRLRRLFRLVALDEQRQARFQSARFFAQLPGRLTARAINFCPTLDQRHRQTRSLGRQMNARRDDSHIHANPSIDEGSSGLDVQTFFQERNRAALVQQHPCPYIQVQRRTYTDWGCDFRVGFQSRKPIHRKHSARSRIRHAFPARLDGRHR